MNFLEIENFFQNSSFFLLFLSMISYWIGVSFQFKTVNFGRFIMIGANFCLLSLLILRWKESGHFPLSNLYESLMFLSWSLSTFHLILENVEFNQESFLKIENLFLKNLNKTGEFKQPILGAFTAPPALFTNAFATFSLPSEMQHASALVPALQSNWLMMHVTVMILSYSALICGSLLSIAFLIFTNNLDMDSNENQFSTKGISDSSKLFDQKQFVPSTSFVEPFSLAAASAIHDGGLTEIQNSVKGEETKNEFFSSSNSLKKKFAEKLDNLSYRILGIGFPFLTIGILSGAVWANEAWGSYWSWDPKETWAFVSIMVYAFVLHMRLVPGLRSRYAFHLATMFAFWSMVMTYFGVNYYLSGLHSYAAGDPIPVPIEIYISFGSMVLLGIFSYIKFKKLKQS